MSSNITILPETPTKRKHSEDFPFEEIYESQLEVLRNVQKGRNVLLSSGTSSGKTEAIIAALAKEMVDSREICTVLGTYPTKALVINQLQRFQAPSLMRKWLDKKRIAIEDVSNFSGTVYGKKLLDRMTRKIALGTPDKWHWLWYQLYHDRKRVTENLLHFVPIRTIRFHDEIHVFDSIGFAHMILDELRMKLLLQLHNERNGTDLVHRVLFSSATTFEWQKELLKKMFDVAIVEGPGNHSKITLEIVKSEGSAYIDFLKNEIKSMMKQIKGDSIVILNSKRRATMLSQSLTNIDFQKFLLTSVNPEGYTKYDHFKQDHPDEEAVLIASPSAEVGISHKFTGLITEETVSHRLIQRIGRAGRGPNDEAIVKIVAPLGSILYHDFTKWPSVIERQELYKLLKSTTSSFEKRTFMIPSLIQAVHYNINKCYFENLKEAGGTGYGRYVFDVLNEEMFENDQWREIMDPLVEVETIHASFPEMFLKKFQGRSFAIRNPIPGIAYLPTGGKQPTDGLLTALWYLSAEERTKLPIEKTKYDRFILGKAYETYYENLWKGKRLPVNQKLVVVNRIDYREFELGSPPESSIPFVSFSSPSPEEESYLKICIEFGKGSWQFIASNEGGSGDVYCYHDGTPIRLDNWFYLRIQFPAATGNYRQLALDDTIDGFALNRFIFNKRDYPINCWYYLDWNKTSDGWEGFEKFFGTAYEVYQDLVGFFEKRTKGREE